MLPRQDYATIVCRLHIAVQNVLQNINVGIVVVSIILPSARRKGNKMSPLQDDSPPPVEGLLQVHATLTPTPQNSVMHEYSILLKTAVRQVRAGNTSREVNILLDEGALLSSPRSLLMNSVLNPFQRRTLQCLYLAQHNTPIGV